MPEIENIFDAKADDYLLWQKNNPDYVSGFCRVCKSVRIKTKRFVFCPVCIVQDLEKEFGNQVSSVFESNSENTAWFENRETEI